MTTPRVLLLGGHGRVSLHLTPLLLSKKWNVTSVIRNPDHEKEILDLGKDQPGKVDVLIESLEDVKSQADAQKVLDQIQPDIVVWSAGAGGKGGPDRTFAVDRDAAKHYIGSSIATPGVKKFLMISYIASRKGRPSWWTDEDKKSADHVNTEVLPKYYEAKVDADYYFASLAHKRNQTDKSFQAINLRPGTLKDESPTGKVLLGKTPARGDVTRGDVAAVAAELLVRDDSRGWYDLLQGDTPVKEAVDQVLKEGLDTIEGEDLDAVYASA